MIPVLFVELLPPTRLPSSELFDGRVRKPAVGSGSRWTPFLLANSSFLFFILPVLNFVTPFSTPLLVFRDKFTNGSLSTPPTQDLLRHFQSTPFALKMRSPASPKHCGATAAFLFCRGVWGCSLGLGLGHNHPPKSFLRRRDRSRSASQPRAPVCCFDIIFSLCRIVLEGYVPCFREWIAARYARTIFIPSRLATVFFFFDKKVLRPLFTLPSHVHHVFFFLFGSSMTGGVVVISISPRCCCFSTYQPRALRCHFSPPGPLQFSSEVLRLYSSSRSFSIEGLPPAPRAHASQRVVPSHPCFRPILFVFLMKTLIEP